MRLSPDGEPREFVPVKAFRAAHGLPPAFGVSLFEPKDYTGLGSIEAAGAQLNRVRAAVLNALPARLAALEWLAFLPQLNTLFASQLYAINDVVGLKDVEIDFAVGGFSDVCQAFAYALVRAGSERKPPPTFDAVYGDWLNSTIRISHTVYTYPWHGQEWQIQVVTHAYGRAGLIVTTPTETHYVHDPALGCPAEGFMASLLREVAERMAAAAVSPR